MLCRLKTDSTLLRLLILATGLLLSGSGFGFTLPNQLVGKHKVTVKELGLPDRIGLRQLNFWKTGRRVPVTHATVGYKSTNETGRVNLVIGVPDDPANMPPGFTKLDEIFAKTRKELAVFVQNPGFTLHEEPVNMAEEYIFSWEKTSTTGIKTVQYRHGIRYRRCNIVIRSGKAPDELDKFLQAGKNAVDIILDAVAQTPETPEAGVKVRVELDDADDQLTPADEAELVLTVSNSSETHGTGRLKLSGRLGGPLTANNVIRFYDVNGSDSHQFDAEHGTLGPGGAWELRKTIRSAGERNAWIYNNLVKRATDDAKPEPEPGVKLEELLELKLVEVREEDSERVLFEEPVSIHVKGAKEIATLTYPDLTSAAYLWGYPAGTTESETGYHRNGDPGWTFPGNEIVRAVALRAARYGADPGVNMDPDASAGTQLLGPGDDDWDSPRMPDNNLGDVVDNLVHFVHQSLFPKVPAGNRSGAKVLARDFWKGQYGPGRPRPLTKPFICQSHSFFLGGLLRALGLPAREVNVHHWPLKAIKKYFNWNLPGLVGNVIGNLVTLRWLYTVQRQDAGTQVWYDGDWHTFQLFHKKRVYTEKDHHLLYTFGKFYWVYDMWVGKAPWPETANGRFNTKWGDQFTSPAWRYHGYGDKDGFTQLDAPILGEEWFPFYIYKWHSPLAAMVVLPDGSRVGTDQAVEIAPLEPLYLNPDKWPSHIVNEVPDAAYLPEGIRFYSDASDPESGPPQPQAIMMPAENAEAYKKHLIIMTGTGDGPFRIEATYVEKDKATVVGRYEGAISRGQRIELFGDQLTVGAVVPPAIADTPWTQLNSLVDAASRRLTVSANGTRFSIGDPLVITVDVDRDGYLNVLNLGPGDTAPTVLYPNQLHPDNRVTAGQRIRIPGSEDWFELQAQGPAGKNLVVVVHTLDRINAYTDGSGNPEDLFKTLSASRGFAVKARKSRSDMGAGKLELVVE